MPNSPMSWSTPWQEADGWEALAAFASKDCLPGSMRGARSPEEMYTWLLKANWSYVKEPWNSGQGQFVRDPDAILAARAATCLDVAVIFCAMALDFGMRPRLAIMEGKSSRHALVLLSEQPSEKAHSVWQQARFTRAEDFLAVDVVQALQAKSWEEALRAGQSLFTGARYQLCHLIDVARAQEDGWEPVAPLPPDSTSRPSIYQMLPPPAPIEQLSRWQEEVADATQSRYVVVAGPSGMGKSTAVLPVARQAAHGSGWLLPASDANALLTSYATAVSRGRPRLGEAIKAAAPLAMQRLRQSIAPWVVIIDGADHPEGPSHYQNLIPEPQDGQVVFITTTESEQWRSWRADALYIEVDPDAASPLVAGLGGRNGDDVGDLVADRLGSMTTEQLDFARTLAWLPAVPAAVPSGMTAEDVTGLYDRLVEVGFVNASTQLMHNLVKEALRKTHAPEAGLMKAFVEAYPMQFSADSSDRLDELLTLLHDQAARDEVALALADARTRDHSPWSARLYASALRSLGCFDADDGVVSQWMPADPAQARLARRCLEGVARSLFRNRQGYLAAKAVADKGLELGSYDEDLLLDSRLRALELNARRTSVSADKTLAPDQRYEALRQILSELEAVHAWRKDARVKDVDVNRARFNLAGPKLRLGQLAAVVRNPGRTPAQWFASANEDYAAVYDWRHGYYGTDDIEDVATCLNGQSAATYFLALCDPQQAHGLRTRLLGEAAGLCARAMVSRLIVASADGGMSNEVRGSAKMLTKIAAAQQELNRIKGEPWQPLTETVAETIQDWDLFSG